MCQKSNHPDYKVGDIVEDRSRLQQYAFGPGPAMRRIDPSLAPISPGMAHMRIARQSFNYGILGETGFRTLADVVEQSQSFDFTYGNMHDAVQLLGRQEFLSGRFESTSGLGDASFDESATPTTPAARADA